MGRIITPCFKSASCQVCFLSSLVDRIMDIIDHYMGLNDEDLQNEVFHIPDPPSIPPAPPVEDSEEARSTEYDGNCDITDVFDRKI